MKKPMYAERLCYAWGELGNVSDQPPAHNEKGHVWKVRVTDERVPTACTSIARLVNAMRELKELAVLPDAALCAFVYAATGIHVEFYDGAVLARLEDLDPHEWKAGDKFTIGSKHVTHRVYRVHKVHGNKIAYVFDSLGGKPKKGDLRHAYTSDTGNWRFCGGP